MRFSKSFILGLLLWSQCAFADETESLLRATLSERNDLAGCLSDSLTVVQKYELKNKLFPLADTLEAVCAVEFESLKSAARQNWNGTEAAKQFIAGGLALEMLEKSAKIAQERSQISCAGNGCLLQEYRACLMEQIPAAVQARKKPIDFENQSMRRCEKSESAARISLTNDFEGVQRRHQAGGLTHAMNDKILSIIADTRHEVVVFYAEDLVKVQPQRKSCRPQMCGASPCISLGEEPTEYECAIGQP